MFFFVLFHPPLSSFPLSIFRYELLLFIFFLMICTCDIFSRKCQLQLQKGNGRLLFLYVCWRIARHSVRYVLLYSRNCRPYKQTHVLRPCCWAKPFWKRGGGFSLPLTATLFTTHAPWISARFRKVALDWLLISTGESPALNWACVVFFSSLPFPPLHTAADWSKV